MSFFSQNANAVTRRIASKVVSKLTEMKATVLDEGQEETLISDVALLVYPVVSLIFETKRAAVESIDDSELILTIRDAFMKEVGEATRESHDQLIDTLSTLALQAVVRRVIAYDSGETRIEEDSDVAQDAADAIIAGLKSMLAPHSVVVPIAGTTGVGYKYYEVDLSTPILRSGREISYQEYTKMCDSKNEKYTITQSASTADETKKYFSTEGGFTVLLSKDSDYYEVLTDADVASLNWSSLDTDDPTPEERLSVAEFLAEQTAQRKASKGTQRIIRDTKLVTEVSQESISYEGGKTSVHDVAGQLSHPISGARPFILPFSRDIAKNAVSPVIVSELRAAFEITGYPIERVESVMGLPDKQSEQKSGR